MTETIEESAINDAAPCGEVVFDEPSGACHLKFIGPPTTVGGANLLSELIERLATQSRRLVILDLSQASPWLSADVRRMLSEKSKLIQADNQAIIVTNPVVRMLAKTMLVWLGSGAKAKFVKDVDEARAYLNG